MSRQVVGALWICGCSVEIVGGVSEWKRCACCAADRGPGALTRPRDLPNRTLQSAQEPGPSVSAANHIV